MSVKVFEGLVNSNKMQKTLVVSVTRKYRESRIGKIVSTRKKYKVHCEDSTVAVGDRVSFAECSPISKEKKFRFLKVVKKGDVIDPAALE
ncbi:MAG: 30S ribosomal protein S17 [Bdellovibrionales bacterium]|nr:30S ribosomal protein S17 [Bdellovibrionales bacterium]